MRQTLFSLSLVFLFNLPFSVLGQSTSQTTTLSIVQKNISVSIKPTAESCTGAKSPSGGTTYVGCLFQFVEIPKGGQFLDREFQGDEYFDVDVRISEGVMTLEFQTFDIEVEDFINEIVDYYSSNEVSYLLTYQGPDFEDKNLGTPLPQ